MRQYRSTTCLRRELASREMLLILAYITAGRLAPVLCRVRLHLWDDNGRCA